MITNKPLPVLYNIKSECCGCTACYAICSRSAITMYSDEEGFAYPYINEEKCIRCYMCIKVCPIKKCKEK
ncbi:4Fe-4S dicluster domain-containing protein [Ruminococcus sp. AF27-12AA]|nr:4Fe-4S dicluster domain-containing protein [Ruminococcus sp. AF27-3]RGG06441.1 4Fe-4S dicluster domain-containing protein [Ruminococcus sp. AF27-12AA]RGG11003.1 4Fe-4S dicluster domain-containing protein [Ruminococcus sp. AF27-11AA]